MNCRLSKKLLELFEQRAKQIHPEKFKPSPSKEEILEFTQAHGIDLREDHLQFLMKYGGGFIETYYGTNSFEDFKDYYLDPDEASVRLNNEQITPPGSTYFSFDPYGEATAINNKKGHLGDFYGADGVDNINYSNISSLLFHYYIDYSGFYRLFDSKKEDIVSDDKISSYRVKYLPYKIDHIYISGLDI